MRLCENPVMTFPIKKIIDTKLFIGRAAALYILISRIRDEINKGDQPAKPAGWRGKSTLC